MPELSSDPRYAKWQQTVRVWRKSGHPVTDPIPITPGELEELEEIFPAYQRFQLKDSLDEVIAIFGKPTNQRFVVINGPKS